MAINSNANRGAHQKVSHAFKNLAHCLNYQALVGSTSYGKYFFFDFFVASTILSYSRPENLYFHGCHQQDRILKKRFLSGLKN